MSTPYTSAAATAAAARARRLPARSTLLFSAEAVADFMIGPACTRLVGAYFLVGAHEILAGADLRKLNRCRWMRWRCSLSCDARCIREAGNSASHRESDDHHRY